MGNVIGSNIFNILFVLASSSVISPLRFTSESVWDCVILIAISLIMYLFCCSGRTVSRKEGAVSILLYCGYMAYIIQR